jgi:23S rRNA (pseudouridine1915-N3)-methyltransferase
VIGGADGLHQDTKERADILLSFGRQTWPHMMVRVMLAEQIYRMNQIMQGHPYHRD